MTALPRTRGALAAVAGAAALFVGALVAAAGPGGAEPALTAIALAAVIAAIVMLAPAASLALLVVAGPVKATPVADALPVDLSAVAIVVVALAAARAAWTGRGRFFRPGIAPALMLLLGAWVMVTLLWSPAGTGAAGKAWEFAGLSAVAFVAAMLMALSPTAGRDLAAGLAVAATAVAWFAAETGHAARPLALPGSTSEIDLGFIAALGVIAIAAYLVPRSPGWWKVAWAVPLAVIVPKLVGAGSRGALLAALIGMAVVLVAQAATWPRRRPAVAGATVLLAAGVAVAWTLSPPAARERYAEGFAGLSSGGVGGALSTAGGQRGELAGRAADMFADAPWGAGTGAYTAITGWTWPHNLIAETAAELGLVGLGLVLALVIVVIGMLVRGLHREPDDIRVMALGLVVVPLVLSMSSFDLNGNRILWTMLGLAAGVAAVRPVARHGP